jgi:hypothetical protein
MPEFFPAEQVCHHTRIGTNSRFGRVRLEIGNGGESKVGIRTPPRGKPEGAKSILEWGWARITEFNGHPDTSLSTDLTTSDGRLPKTLAKLNRAVRDGLFSPRSSWPM